MTLVKNKMATDENLNFLIACIRDGDFDEIRYLINKYNLSKDEWLIVIYELADADRFDLISKKMKDIFGDLNNELGYEILEKAIRKNCPPLAIYLIENGLRVRHEDLLIASTQNNFSKYLYEILKESFDAANNLDNSAKSARMRK
jgi:hypothetical protein